MLRVKAPERASRRGVWERLIPQGKFQSARSAGAPRDTPTDLLLTSGNL